MLIKVIFCIDVFNVFKEILDWKLKKEIVCFYIMIFKNIEIFWMVDLKLWLVKCLVKVLVSWCLIFFYLFDIIDFDVIFISVVFVVKLIVVFVICG